jgi:hypothetical protein
MTDGLYDIEQAAMRLGTNAFNLRRFCRQMERALGMRGSPGSGERYVRRFTEEQLNDLEKSWNMAKGHPDKR